MKNLLIRMLYLANTLLRIRQFKTQSDFKKVVARTWFNTFFLKKYNRHNRTFDMADFKIQFISHHIITFLFEEIFLNNDYFFIADAEAPTIIDCGSNIGMSVFYFKFLYPKSRIIAFEPGEAAFLCLQSNVKNNSLQLVDTVNAAVSNYDGQIHFYYDEDNVGSLRMSTKRDRMPKQCKQVQAVRLSNYIDSDIDFVKIDVEGAELDVLEDLINSEKIRFIRQMIIEYHHHLIEGVDEFSKLIKCLESSGFGYQISGYLNRPLIRNHFQDILVYAYRK